MVSDLQSSQRIARLTPLADVLTWVDANVRAIAPSNVGVADTVGRALANDVEISRALPPAAISLRDGFALQSDWTSDANAYAPAPLAAIPLRVDAGDVLPPGADCVAALEQIAIKGARAEALAVVAPGEGILPAGGDAGANQPLLRRGKRLHAYDAAILRIANVSQVSVRAPRISVVHAGREGDAIIASAASMVAAAITADGGIAMDTKSTLESALQGHDADAIIAIGGTGAGRNDTSVTTLSRIGKVAFHGIGLLPGDTTAIGDADGMPALLVPGRIDAALACWLVLGRKILARLAGADISDATTQLKLSRKITSTIGIADVVLLKRRGGEVDPLASDTWPMQALAQADFYVVVAPESEGFPAGASVNASPLP